MFNQIMNVVLAIIKFHSEVVEEELVTMEMSLRNELYFDDEELVVILAELEEEFLCQFPNYVLRNTKIGNDLIVIVAKYGDPIKFCPINKT